MNNEDIKVLEEYLDKQDRKFVSEYRLALLQAIENLINRNKELEEEVERRIEKEVLDYRYVDKNMLRKDIIQRDYIPKSKVRKKIEELEKFIESKRILPVDIIEDQNRNVKWKIEVLQELLEGDDK